VTTGTTARPGAPSSRHPSRRRDLPAPGEAPQSSAGYLVFLIPGLVLFALVIALPFAMNLWFSLTNWQGVGSPEWTGLDNYRRLLEDETFWASFRHNAALIVAMAIVPTALGLLLAAALFDYIGKKFGTGTVAALRACFYLPQILPIAVAGVVWGWILNPTSGALNASLEKVGLGSLTQDWLGDPSVALFSVMVIMVWVQLGFPVVIFMAGLQRVDPALYEAAEIDGASWMRRFWHITLPQIKPEVYVVLLWTTIAALKVFGPIYVLTRGGPGGATNVPAYYSYQNFFERTQVGYGAAISTVLTLLIVALSVVFLRIQTPAEEAS
jgi:raffinose/stachyose/melibiose transport system permease protein